MSNSVFKKHLALTKPVNAVRLTDDNLDDVKREMSSDCIEISADRKFLQFTVKTSCFGDIVHRAEIGDWIIKKEDGSFDFDFNEIFRTRYQTEPSENDQNLSNLLCVLAEISNMCVGDLAMEGYKLDAQVIGELIYKATNMTNSELNEHAKRKEAH